MRHRVLEGPHKVYIIVAPGKADLVEKKRKVDAPKRQVKYQDAVALKE